MGLIGNFAKGFLILTVAFWIFLMVEFAVMGQLAVALFLFLGFLIPLGIVVYWYWKDKKRLSQVLSFHQVFAMSHLLENGLFAGLFCMDGQTCLVYCRLSGSHF